MILLFSAVCLSLTAGCKSGKQLSSSANTPASGAQTNSATNGEAEPVYRLIVSFTSKGAGTNAEKREAFLKYVESHPKKPAYKEVFWGREGETDYCLVLSELPKKEQVSFVEEVRKAMTGSDQVILTEHTPSLHRGR